MEETDNLFSQDKIHKREISQVIWSYNSILEVLKSWIKRVIKTGLEKPKKLIEFWPNNEQYQSSRLMSLHTRLEETIPCTFSQILTKTETGIQYCATNWQKVLIRTLKCKRTKITIAKDLKVLPFSQNCSCIRILQVLAKPITDECSRIKFGKNRELTAFFLYNEWNN